MSSGQTVYVDFGKPPPGYVPGIGRGATGFTTQQDIGPGAGVGVPGGGRGARSSSGRGGRGGGRSQLSAEDREADAIWTAVDLKMSAHTRAAQEHKAAAAEAAVSSLGDRLGDQFSDLRRDLATVSVDEWAAIPEPGAFASAPRETANAAGSMPLPDSVLRMQVEGMGGSGSGTGPGVSSLSAAELAGQGAQLTDLRKLGEARTSAMEARLDVAGGSAGSGVDVAAYLGELEAVTTAASAQVADRRRMRDLLASLRASYSAHAPSWIAAARLEESAGKLRAAREIALEGCVEVPTSEDLWLEAARLCSPEEGKRVLAQAAAHLPGSEAVWLAAMRLENAVTAKRTVLRKALEANPTSALLWKSAVQLEDPENAAILLGEAVKCVPKDVDLWLALARLQRHGEARKTLNDGLAAVDSQDHIRLWIAAAKLEESALSADGTAGAVDLAHDVPHDNVLQVVAAAKAALSGTGYEPTLDGWLELAERAEATGFPATGQAVVLTAYPEAKKGSVAAKRAKELAGRGMGRAAAAVLAAARARLPKVSNLWVVAVNLADGLAARLTLLDAATQALPSSALLWLMYAKTTWKAGDLSRAREILASADGHIPGSEPILLAAAKLETLAGEAAAAGQLLQRARAEAPSARVWVRSAVHARRCGDTVGALELVNEGLARWPDAVKLVLIKGSVLGGHEAEQVYTAAVVGVGASSVAVWIALAQLQVDRGALVAARATLERARTAVPDSDHIVEAAAKVELLSGNTAAAGKVVADGLVAHPESGRLWALAIDLEPASKKRSRAMDAVRAAKTSPRVLVYVAQLFLFLRVTDKARSWLRHARTSSPSYGDAWAWSWAVETLDGGSTTELESAAATAEPTHGDLWVPRAKHDTQGVDTCGWTAVLRAVGADCLALYQQAQASGVFGGRGWDRL